MKNDADKIGELIGNPEKPLFGGFSKSFYRTADPDVLLVKFKDAMHGRGKTQEIAGTGRLREEFCFYFNCLLEREGIRTHIADKIGDVVLVEQEALREKGMLVRRLDMIALELIARFVTRGNWADQHKFPVFPAGVELDQPIIEFCLKWKQAVPNLDFQHLPEMWKRIHSLLANTPLERLLMPKEIVRDDPRLDVDVALALHKHSHVQSLQGHLVTSREEWEELRVLTLRVNKLLAEFMRSQGWKLEDGKCEAGVLPGDSTRRLIIGDEYTQDSMRATDKSGSSLTKDLHRQRKPASQIYDGYAQLTEAMRSYIY